MSKEANENQLDVNDVDLDKMQQQLQLWKWTTKSKMNMKYWISNEHLISSGNQKEGGYQEYSRELIR